MSDIELGAFLRSCREAITPTEVGLPTGSRRRTPGLRRAELATLARISVEYLARLEQGRDRHPSPGVLAALADALRLTLEQRDLLRLTVKAAGSDGHFLCPAQPPAQSIRPTVRALLDSLDPTPAVLLNRLGDVLAYTTGFERLVRPIGLLDGQHANLVRFVFTDPRARTAYLEWDRVADEHVAKLKIQSTFADPHVRRFTDELTVLAGAPFTDRLAAPPKIPSQTGVERLVHPDAGELRLSYETLELPGPGGQHLLVYLPADASTTAALDTLTTPHLTPLRAVQS